MEFREIASPECLVQRSQWQVGGKRSEPRNRCCQLLESVNGERPMDQRVPPIVRITDDQLGKIAALAEEVVFQQPPHLPVTFSFTQAQMHVNEMQWSVGGLDDRQLCAARLFRLPGELDLMMRLKRPAREHQVTISTRFHVDIQLIHAMSQLAQVAQ